jgi:hypothetical protein
MNERIKELLNRSGGEFYEGFLGSPNTIKFTEEELKTFAELIVKECVDICNQAILQNQDTLSKLNVDELAEKMVIHGSINQAQKLGKGIKEHFGVEE